ncbi:hypothetical protein B4Q13_17810, partial [Lacticaseibacillus rhamnosus]
MLIDQVGSLGLRRSFFAPLVEAGGEFAWFRDAQPLRSSHRPRMARKRTTQNGFGTLTIPSFGCLRLRGAPSVSYRRVRFDFALVHQ